MTEFNTTRAPSVSDLRELFAARPAVLSAINEAFKLSGGFCVRAARWQVLPARFSSAGAAHAAQRALRQRFHLLQALYLTLDTAARCPERFQLN